MLLAEVLFDPAPGDSPFVELLNAGQTPTDLTGMALGVGDMQLPLIRVAAPLAPGARLLVRFDGQGRVDAGVLHLPASVTLNAESGAVELIDGRGERVDRVAWGEAADAVDSTSDFGEELPRGRAIGRPPGANRPLDLTQWVTFAPSQASPGADNPLFRVELLVPLNGAVIQEPSAILRWYAVVGAARYRVQVARGESFASPVLDVTTTTSRVDATQLGPGRYLWRVQSIDLRGGATEFSDPNTLEIRRGVMPSRQSARATTIGVLASLSAVSSAVVGRRTAQGSTNPCANNPECLVLDVPFLPQHKDSQMLQLENRHQSGAHAWDRDHKAYDEDDPADNMNCVLASVAMVNRFYGGNLTQDRIGYEVLSRNIALYTKSLLSGPQKGVLARVLAAHPLQERKPGPEMDLSFGPKGLSALHEVAAVTFALGAVPTANLSYPSPEETWARITAQLRLSRPVIGSMKVPGGRHAFVVRGFREDNGRRFFMVNDPISGQHEEDVVALSAGVKWLLLPDLPAGAQLRGRRQELSVTQDSDFDGVVDFDETERFFTDPNNRDSDGDGVWDREDIASGVFDPTYGYAFQTASRKGRDFDADDLPTERDLDSDAGGCRDGVEDADSSGHRDKPETWNFDDGDDLCNDVSGHVQWSVKLRRTGPLATLSHETGLLTVALTPERPGELGPLVDKGSRYRVRSVATLTLPANGGCQPHAREVVSGSGTFGAPGTEMGGTVTDDELVIGAIASSVPGTSTADLCFMAGSSTIEGAASLPDCTGQRVGTSRSFRFSCTTPPPAPPDVEILEWSITGSVTIAAPRQSPPPP